MLKLKSPQESFYGSYLYDRIVLSTTCFARSTRWSIFLLQGKCLRTGTIRILAGQRRSRVHASGCAYYNIFIMILIDRCKNAR